MQNSLLFKIASSFSPKERTRFGLFINTPYFNPGTRGAKIIEFWDLVNAGLEQSDKPFPSRETLYAHLFPNQVFNLGKMKKLMHQLVQLLNQFLVIENKAMDTSASAYQLAVQNQYQKRGLNAEAKTKIKSLLKEQQAKQKTAQNLYEQFLINEVKFQQDSLQINRREDLNLPKVLHQLDYYYLFTRLEYTFQVLAINQWICPIDYEPLLERMDLNLKHLPEAIKEAPVFSLYLLAYRLLKDFPKNNTLLFKKFLQAFDRKKDHCTKEQQKAFQAFSRNFCIYFYHQGKDEFSQLAFHLYQQHLKEGLLYHGGKIFAGTFHNLVLLGIRNQEMEWVKTYIEDHRHKILGSDEEELVYQFSLATLEFYQGAYEKALDLIPLHFKDQYLILAARRLEIMIYYELQSVVFSYKLEAYKIYVYRLKKDANLQKTKDQNRNFVDLLKQIIHPKTMGNSTRIQKLLKKIETTKNLAEKPWLQEKLLLRSDKTKPTKHDP